MEGRRGEERGGGGGKIQNIKLVEILTLKCARRVVENHNIFNYCSIWWLYNRYHDIVVWLAQHAFVHRNNAL